MIAVISRILFIVAVFGSIRLLSLVNSIKIFGKKVNKKMKLKDMTKIGAKKAKFWRIITLISILFSILLESIYFLNEQSNLAVVEVMGTPKIVEGAGIHFKIPYFSTKKKINMDIRSMEIGYFKEDYENEEMITSDLNLLNTSFYVQYRVIDAKEYVYGCSNPESVLKNIAQECILSIIGKHKIDRILTVERSNIQNEMQEDIQKNLQGKMTGLELVQINIDDIRVPVKVQKAFEAAETAKYEAQVIIEKAKTYKEIQYLLSISQADKYKKDAKIARKKRINEARSEMESFKNIYEEYCKNPDDIKLNLYYQNVGKLLQNSNVVINCTDSLTRGMIE